MIFHEIIGNINEIDDLNGYHVETIYLNSEDMLKRILRVTSDHNREYGITLDNNEKLKDGDIITKIDNEKITTTAEFKYYLYKHKIGDTVKVTYIRNGKEGNCEVKLTKESE